MSSFQAIKTSLRCIAKNDITIDKINDVVLRTHRIVVHTLQFMKLYILYCVETGIDIPAVDRAFVMSAMKVLSVSDPRGVKASGPVHDMKIKLEAFKRDHYNNHINQDEQISCLHLGTVLEYECTKIITVYETNIKQHFIEYVERYVNVVWKKKSSIETIKGKSSMSSSEKKAAINSICSQMRRIKNDIFSINAPMESEDEYHSWILEQRASLLPTRSIKKDSIKYDIQCSPQDYLKSSIIMMRKVEELGYKTMNVLPTRSSSIPGYITIDTTVIMNVLLTGRGLKRDYKGVAEQRQVWGFFLKTEKKLFHLKTDKHRYTFHHMIETDGVGCSILLVRRDLAGRRMIRSPKHTDTADIYVDELSGSELSDASAKAIVAIDPNMSDLLFCVDGDGKDQTKFRYTQDTRRKETKVKRYRKISDDKKGAATIDGKTVKELETELSLFNRKALNFDRFKEYLIKKNEINILLESLYRTYIFRKLRLGSYMRRQVAEDRLLKRFKQKFGTGEEAIVCIGDWEQRKHRKFKEPVKGKGWRGLLRKAGYQVFLVDEFGTSARCSACKEGVCKTFRECKNPRPWMNNTIIRHGLVRCQTCHRLWNRDVNAASNIYKIAFNALHGLERPVYLQRGT